MMRLFEPIHASGVTTILVTHLMDDVADYADTMYVLEKGRIVKSGTTARLVPGCCFHDCASARCA
jgi:energy-coupling factor transport system ATP-binding protein